ncbi:MAG: DegT/DnrJ/EryC1/StrS family aminotransferase [bacterium]
MIPFFDLKTYNAQFHERFHERFTDFLNSGWYVLGNGVKSFEEEFATYCSVGHCIGVANGLDALRLILEGYKTLGKLSEGDEIIVPANTYIATILGIIQAGLKPVLVEPDTETYNITVDAISRAITWKTKGVMVVHLYGLLTEMEAINALAKEKGLLVMEDAAQAHGALNTKGEKAGSLSNAAGFSFYPTKNLGALGDAGAITTNDSDLAEIVLKLRNYGTSQKYVSDHIGWNSRLDEIQAVFLSEKLKELDKHNRKRIEIASRYSIEIKNPKIQTSELRSDGRHVYHQYVVRTKFREALQEHLRKNEIGFIVHYPIPPHKQEALADYQHLNFPITEGIHEEVLSIPMNPGLSDQQVKVIIETMNSF